MLIVKIELHSARTGKVETLGQMVIDNVGGAGKGRYDKLADYRVRVGRKGGTLQGVLDKPLREGRVDGYPRLSYNVWRLVLRALRATFPEER
jgi:hypothetical protein